MLDRQYRQAVKRERGWRKVRHLLLEALVCGLIGFLLAALWVWAYGIGLERMGQ